MNNNNQDYFNQHVATLEKHGRFNVINFQKENRAMYHMQFIFDTQEYTLTIIGDFYTLIAKNKNNMAIEHFRKHFCNNPHYFSEKILAMEQPKYLYDEDIARKQVIEQIKNGCETEDYFDEEIVEYINSQTGQIYSTVEEFIDDIFSYWLGEEGGFGDNIPEQLLKAIDDDYWEWAYDLGETLSPYIKIYLKALDLALEQLSF